MKKSIRLFVGALAALVACGAHATLIEKWQLELFTRFDVTSVVPGAVNPIVPGAMNISNNDQSLRWGDDNNDSSTTPDHLEQSGLDITNVSPTDIETNGAAVLNTSITHINNPVYINTYPALDTVTILSTLTLTPFHPGTDTLLSPPAVNQATIPFLVEFQETTNGLDPCPDGGDNGEGLNAKGCADIFVIFPTDLKFPFQYAYPDTHSPRTYMLRFFETEGKVGPLSPEACMAATLVPCIGFKTQEEENTTINFAAQITAVPEPTTLLLMGLGLAGLGFARRRRLNG